MYNEQAAAKSENFLFDEIGQRLANGPVQLGVFVQMAEPDDRVANASVTRPDIREEIPFCTITLTARVDDQVRERSKILSILSQGLTASIRRVIRSRNCVQTSTC